MGAIGQLAGGVAHDFNNQLTGILGYAELLAKRLAEPEAKRSAERIAQAALRASDLTRQLLAFARKGKYLTVTVHVHELIHEVVGLLAHSIDKRIRIEERQGAAVDTVLGDPSQLQNALLNLALNARDAMPEGGELSFVTRIEEHEGDDELPAGRYLAVVVADTGVGMSAEVQGHLFEPFFTTKEPGKGTGLGLAAVYGAVQSHGGAIAVDSAPGRGSAFTIRLPLRRSASSMSLPVLAPAKTAEAHILVVDDEELVRSLLTEMLRGSGYRVTTCADGVEAVDLYRQSWQGIDLVILDMVMPRLGGAETFAALRAVSPSVRVLLSSGYSLGGEAQALLDQGVRGFVQKPFRAADLLRQIGEILRG
jgi:CheY-like chemotaxis protein